MLFNYFLSLLFFNYVFVRKFNVQTFVSDLVFFQKMMCFVYGIRYWLVTMN